MSSITRPPVVAIMGHVDHGKSTLLDTIRNTNIVATEAGGITQHVSAYEVLHPTPDGDRRITFIDTPGHAAFQGMRARSAAMADIAILIVAADDGVKAQTLQALQTIQENNVPFIVAINKIDRPTSDPERIIRELMENNVFVEGYGGDISYVKISAKTGTGISELLETILLLADINEYTCDPDNLASGYIVESNTDTKRGIAATLLIKDGTLHKGEFVVSGPGIATLRSIYDHRGNTINTASACSPVTIYGFSNQPPVGETFSVYTNRTGAETAVTEYTNTNRHWDDIPTGDETTIIPVVLKCDVAGSIDAVVSEIRKHNTDRIYFKIVSAGVGDISETDIRMAATDTNSIIIGFHVGSDPRVRDMNEARGLTIEFFSVIYKMSEWLETLAEDRKFRKQIESVVGTGQILKVFSNEKNQYLIGVRVASGELSRKRKIRLVRNRDIISHGSIISIQMAKSAYDRVESGDECGMVAELSGEPKQFDIIEAIEMIEG